MIPPVRIPRPAPDEYHPYYGGYVGRVAGDDAFAALETQLETTLAPIAALGEAGAAFRYAPDRWSVREVLGHVADAERVFAYRALRFARADRTPLPGFEQQDWVPFGRFDARPLAELLDELRAVRAATLALFRGFDPDALARRGNAASHEISVRALAWVIAGHELHHRHILDERYGVGSGPPGPRRLREEP